MKRKIISIILVILLLQYYCGFVFAENTNDINQTSNETTNVEANNQISEELSKQQEEVKEKLNSTNLKLEYVKTELSSTMLQVQELEDKVLKYQSEMTELTDSLDTLEKSISEAKDRLKVVEADYNEKEQLLAERLVTIYEEGETRYLDLLLSTSDIVGFVSGYFLISEMVEYDNNLIQEVNAKRIELETVKTKLEKEETEAKVIKAKKEQTTIVLQNTITLQSSYAEKLTSQERQLQEEITKYKQEQAKIEYLIRQATNSSIDMDIQYTGGTMLWPVAITGTAITSTFGYREHPIQGVVKEHTGLDIGNATYGSPVVAAADGVVTYAGWLGGYGNCVMISHGNGLVTLYGHGQKILTELHKEVKQGDLIMEVGSTGNSTGPHLHFEVRLNGDYVNPLNYVKVP